MVGVITKLNFRRRQAVVSAPYQTQKIKLNRRDFHTDTRWDSNLVGRMITFDLQDNRAINAWLTSGDVMAAAAGNNAEVPQRVALSKESHL